MLLVAAANTIAACGASTPASPSTVLKYELVEARGWNTDIAEWQSESWGGPALFVDGTEVLVTQPRTDCAGLPLVGRVSVSADLLTQLAGGLQDVVGTQPHVAATCCSDCGYEALRVQLSDREVVLYASPSFAGCRKMGAGQVLYDDALVAVVGRLQALFAASETMVAESIVPPLVRVGQPSSDGALIAKYPVEPAPLPWPISELDPASFRGSGAILAGDQAARAWAFFEGPAAAAWPPQAACDRYAYIPVTAGDRTYRLAAAPAFWVTAGP